MSKAWVGNDSTRGFSLIEVIVALVVAAILGTMLYTYTLQTRNSALPLTRVSKALDLQKVMENIYTDHKLNSPLTLLGIKAKIGAENSDQDNVYGKYHVVDNHFIQYDDDSKLLTTDPQGMLKVTIKNDLGEQLTGILVVN